MTYLSRWPLFILQILGISDMEESKRKAWYLLLCIIVMMVLLALASCKSVKEATERVRTDTCFVERWRRDSVIIETMKHDSVFVQMKGDTVIFNHWRTEYRDRWRDRIVRDSIYIAKADTVTVETILREEANLTWWQQARMTVGTVTIIIILLMAGMKAVSIFK